jgi:scyllo-inosose 3-dehydrogenase
MKALVVNAEWKPRKDYAVSEDEKKRKRAIIGSQVWRNPSFEIKDIPAPVIHDDEVLIRVKACGLCGSDIHLYETDEEGYIIFSGLTRLPCILGHEFSGIIEEAGEKVIEFKVGDKVAVESIMWCGICRPCRSGNPNQCRNLELLGLTSDGALTEYIAVKEKYCWKINALRDVYSEKDVFEIGAIIEPVGCAYNGMFIAGGGFHPGATVVLYGAGPIGLGAVALSKAAGASTIIAFDRIDERLTIAKEIGADYVFNIEKIGNQKPGEKVMELTQGWGADVQIEAAGAAPVTIPEMERSLSPNGKIIYLGRAATTTPMYLDALVSGANKIIGARGHSGYGIFPSIIKLIASGKLKLEKMITARYSFENVLDAIKASTERTNGKILIRI